MTTPGIIVGSNGGAGHGGGETFSSCYAATQTSTKPFAFRQYGTISTFPTTYHDGIDLSIVMDSTFTLKSGFPNVCLVISWKPNYTNVVNGSSDASITAFANSCQAYFNATASATNPWPIFISMWHEGEATINGSASLTGYAMFKAIHAYIYPKFKAACVAYNKAHGNTGGLTVPYGVITEGFIPNNIGTGGYYDFMPVPSNTQSLPNGVAPLTTMCDFYTVDSYLMGGSSPTATAAQKVPWSTFISSLKSSFGDAYPNLGFTENNVTVGDYTDANGIAGNNGPCASPFATDIDRNNYINSCWNFTKAAYNGGSQGFAGYTGTYPGLYLTFWSGIWGVTWNGAFWDNGLAWDDHTDTTKNPNGVVYGANWSDVTKSMSSITASSLAGSTPTPSAFDNAVLAHSQAGAGFYWELEDAAGTTTAADATGNGVTLACTSVTFNKPSVVDTDAFTSAAFTGASNATSAYTPDPTTSNFFTAALGSGLTLGYCGDWITLPTGAVQDVVGDFGANAGIDLTVDNTGTFRVTLGNGTTSISLDSNVGPSANHKMMVVATWDNTTGTGPVVLYVWDLTGSILVAQTTGTLAPADFSPSANWNVGSSSVVANLGRIFLLPTALTSAQVADLADIGAQGTIAPAGLANVAVAALNPKPKVAFTTASPGSVTVTSYNATTGHVPGTGAVSLAALGATPGVTVAPLVASVAAVAYNATVTSADSTTASPTDADVPAAALQATAVVSAPADVASTVTAAAYDATVSVGATAHAGVAQVTVNAYQAAEVVSATAPAGLGAVTATAYGAAANVAPTVGLANVNTKVFGPPFSAFDTLITGYADTGTAGSYWPFEDNPGSATVADTSGNGHALTPVSISFGTTGIVPGDDPVVYSSATFTSASQGFVSQTIGTGLNNVSLGCIVEWSTVPTSIQHLVGCLSTNFGATIAVNNSGNISCTFGNGTTTKSTTITTAGWPSANKVYLIVATCTSAGAIVLKAFNLTDGTNQSQTTSFTGPPVYASPSTWFIGTKSLAGVIGRVFVLPSALTATQITGLVNAAVSVTAPAGTANVTTAAIDQGSGIGVSFTAGLASVTAQSYYPIFSAFDEAVVAYTSAPDQSGFWTLEDPAGASAVVDASGNYNVLTPTAVTFGGTSIVPTDSETSAGFALSSNVVDANFSIAGSTGYTPDITTGVSIGCVVQWPSVPTTRQHLVNQSTLTTGARINTDPTGALKFAVANGTTQVVITGPTVLTTDAYLMVGTWDNTGTGTVTLYVCDLSLGTITIFTSPTLLAPADYAPTIAMSLGSTDLVGNLARAFSLPVLLSPSQVATLAALAGTTVAAPDTPNVTATAFQTTTAPHTPGAANAAVAAKKPTAQVGPVLTTPNVTAAAYDATVSAGVTAQPGTAQVTAAANPPATVQLAGATGSLSSAQAIFTSPSAAAFNTSNVGRPASRTGALAHTSLGRFVLAKPTSTLAAPSGSVSSASAVLTVGRLFATTISSVSAETATFAVTETTSVTTASVSSATGAFTAVSSLGASTASTSSAAGTFGSVGTSFAGTASSATGESATLTVSQSLAGSAGSTSSASGVLTDAASFTVTAAASTAETGAFTDAVILAGSSASTTTSSGALGVATVLSVSTSSSSDTTTALTAAGVLVITDGSSSTASGSLSVSGSFSVTASSSSAASGALVDVVPLGAVTGSVSSASAVISTPFASTTASNSGETAGFSDGSALSVSTDSVSSATGSLSGIAVFVGVSASVSTATLTAFHAPIPIIYAGLAGDVLPQELSGQV